MRRNHIFTSTASVLAILASFAVMPVSAENVNDYSVSYETLTQAVTADDGDIIPENAVAVTLSIENNSGFNANRFILDITDGYTVITNEEGKPCILVNESLENALTSAAVSSDGDIFCMTMASTEVCSGDGQLFTFYLLQNNKTRAHHNAVSLSEVSPEFASQPVYSNNQTAAGKLIDSMYFIGDTDGYQDDLLHRLHPDTYPEYPVITAADATNILQQCSSATSDIRVNETNIASHFPFAVYYKAPDANRDNVINSDDAQEILDYCACVGAGALSSYTGWVGAGFIIP